MNNITPEPNTAPTPQAPENTAPVNPSSKFKVPGFVNKRNVLIFLSAVAIVALGYFLKNLFVVATVDGKPISRWAVVKELEKQSGRQVLDNFISEKLITNEAGRRDINVTQQEIDDQIKKIEEQISSQGGKLEDVLSAQGMSREELDKQMRLQKLAEKILADKINVSDEEISQYITDNSVTLTAGQEDTQRSQIREEIKQQKFSDEIAKWLSESRESAKIKEFLTY